MGPGRAGKPSRTPIDEEVALSLLTDQRCRAILSALADRHGTAGELLDELDIPCSTLYRKIESLVDAGLLEEQTRVRLDGNNETEYVCPVDGLSLDIAFGDDVRIELTEDDADTATDSSRVNVACSD